MGGPNVNVMVTLLLTSAYAPFMVAFVVMIGIGLTEAIGLGLGELGVDADAGLDGADGSGGVLDWLGLGAGLPILIWLTSLLGCFTMVGVAVQQTSAAITGAPLSAGSAAGIALIVGGFINMFAARGLARIMPSYESTVISQGDFMRQRGTILEGVAKRGHPARAKIIDQHGQAHFVMVEPHHDTDVIAEGETALLVRRDGSIFFVLPDAPTALRPV